MTRSISIIIPAYNEEKRLPATLNRILTYLDGSAWTFAEIVVVDDGSRDGTAKAAKQFPAGPRKIQVLRNSRNRGKGYSVRRGMLEAKGEWALFTDADLSTPIEELETLWSAAHWANASIAIGSRALDRSLIGVHQSLFRENIGRFFNLVMRTVTGLPFRDTQCGFKLFDARAMREIFRRQVLDGFGFDVEVLFIARLLGYQAIDVPVRWNNAEGTKVNALRGLEAFLDPFRVRMNQWKGRYR